MQTRSQTKKLLLLARENDTFEEPIPRKVYAKTSVASASVASASVASASVASASVASASVASASVASASVASASKRVLPDSIKNCMHKPINCALYIPKYIQKPVYEVDIDFDEASEAWRSNKISIGNGEYKYKKRISKF